MKRPALIGLLLTLIMLLMVSTAAVVFMLQGRQTLLNRAERLAGEVAGLDALVIETESTIATRESELATAVAVQATTAAERDAGQALADDRQRELNDVITERDQAEAELAALEEAKQAAVPLVAIISPIDGALLPADTPVDVTVSASDVQGLAAVHISVDDVSLGSFDPEDRRLFTAVETWLPADDGDHVISARAINLSGRASDPVTVTVTVDTGAGGNAQAPVGRPDPNAAQRAAIEAGVAQLRGLEPLTPVAPTLLTGDELRLRLEADLSEETPEDARHDAIVLSAFDFLDRDFDLYNFNLDLYSEQIGGFYDPETAEFVIISDDEELDLLEETVHAHEFVHALQDQHYQLERLDDESLDAEARSALRALAEGDATLVQSIFLFARYLTPEEIDAALNDLAAEDDPSLQQLVFLMAAYMRPNDLQEVFDVLEEVGAETDTAVLDSAPPVLANALQFPYSDGQAFVQYLFENEGGFNAIDAAWQNPPQSSEQILHPDRYLAGDDPQLVSLAPLTETLGAGWQQLDEDVLGEFYLRQYLSQQLRGADTAAAATGWGGDRYAVYWNEADQALAMVLRLVWDTPTDTREFVGRYPAYAAGLTGAAGQSPDDGVTCWQGSDIICLYDLGADTLIIRASDQDIIANIAAAQLR